MATSAASTPTARVPRFLTASLARELGILLCLSVMFPFMIHILPLPEDVRWGPRLLPMFYAPLLAALWGRTQSAVLLAAAAPWLNWALTGHPNVAGGTVMMVELLGFVIALRLFMRGIGARWFLAVPAYVAGKAVALAVVALFPALIGGRPALAWAADTALTGAPGIAILLLINFLVLHYYPPGADGGGPKAA